MDYLANQQQCRASCSDGFRPAGVSTCLYGYGGVGSLLGSTRCVASNQNYASSQGSVVAGSVRVSGQAAQVPSVQSVQAALQVALDVAAGVVSEVIVNARNPARRLEGLGRATQALVTYDIFFLLSPVGDRTAEQLTAKAQRLQTAGSAEQSRFQAELILRNVNVASFSNPPVAVQLVPVETVTVVPKQEVWKPSNIEEMVKLADLIAFLAGAAVMTGLCVGVLCLCWRRDPK